MARSEADKKKTTQDKWIEAVRRGARYAIKRTQVWMATDEKTEWCA